MPKSQNNILFDAIKSKKAQKLFNTIQQLHENGDDLIYYNKLKREAGVSAPTLNKYLDIFKRLDILDLDIGEGEVSEYFISKKNNKKISRKRRILVRTINLKQSENYKKYNKILAELIS